MLNATSLQEIVDAGVVFAGYANTSSYYAHINPINKLGDITTPKFVLNSADDPCCNIANLYETSPYPDHGGKTFAQMIRFVVSVPRKTKSKLKKATRPKPKPVSKEDALKKEANEVKRKAVIEEKSSPMP